MTIALRKSRRNRFGDAKTEKLPGHRPGLPGKVISFHIVPLDPAYKAGLAGHVPVKVERKKDKGKEVRVQHGVVPQKWKAWNHEGFSREWSKTYLN